MLLQVVIGFFSSRACQHIKSGSNNALGIPDAYTYCTIRARVLNDKYLWIRPVLQSGHGVAVRHQGIGRATRTGPSDGSQVVSGWKKGCTKVWILAMSRSLLPEQQRDRQPPVHWQQFWRCNHRPGHRAACVEGGCRPGQPTFCIRGSRAR